MASSTKTGTLDIERPTTMYQGKNIHSSPVDGKLLCSFSEKTCMQRRLNHYAFCIRHVLEDKNSPFKQCKFVAKYNGQRCTNAIPLKEERIYCNSHLQVLGLVPKKSRKKKHTESNTGTGKNSLNSSVMETSQITCNSTSKSTSSMKRKEKCNESLEHTKFSPPNFWKAKVMTSHCSLSNRINTSRKITNTRNLLPFYGVGFSSDEEMSDDDFLNETIDLKSSNTFSVKRTQVNKCESHKEKLKQLRENLNYEYVKIKKSIDAQFNEKKQSDKAHRLLAIAVKSHLSPISADSTENNSSLRSRKRPLSLEKNYIRCTAEISGKRICKRRSLPYTKYCFYHILNDSRQKLFQECCADITGGLKCSRPSLDVLYGKPLCFEHSKGKKPEERLDCVEANALTTQTTGRKQLAKKTKRKPQQKVIPGTKAVKNQRRAPKKDNIRTNSLPRKTNTNLIFDKVKQGISFEQTVNHDSLEKSFFPRRDMERERHHHAALYSLNGACQLDQLSSNEKSIFERDDFKREEMFDGSDMDADDTLENDDLSEDISDISTTAILREPVLPPESPVHNVASSLQNSHEETFAMNAFSDDRFHKPMKRNNLNLSRKDNLFTNDFSSRLDSKNTLDRPPRTTVITLPKYPSSSSVNQPPLRQTSLGLNADYPGFKPIGPGIIKSGALTTKRLDSRPVDINHGVQLLPMPYDPVLNSSVTWGTGNKMLINSRTRPLFMTSQMNPVTFSPPSVSPQINLGSAFNFDRPSVLQHSNSPSPTLSPFSTQIPSSPHGKPRILRTESRGGSNEMHDLFFGTSFEKP
ncbi:uncharacterized protein LOC124439881 isoform X2 [Xenia sp. Carnegie-2017]|uniref:uncharacterized protein LOC124439881 isoform X2 n=1 Tax=Xenia sp. Carnegie-2017 TaxID=2897299 RepID=UPI001F0406D7|nr:uncharacterized protein LOC124439881 isoform X2 [Xenia sp. Carnegie-2017]